MGNERIDYDGGVGVNCILRTVSQSDEGIDGDLFARNIIIGDGLEGAYTAFVEGNKEESCISINVSKVIEICGGGEVWAVLRPDGYINIGGHSLCSDLNLRLSDWASIGSVGNLIAVLTSRDRG
ncbi:unnamed protein product [Sphagnum balticum]